ncbi:MAG: ArsA family ATPase [Bradymonadales bacterium]|nr:ArsA family ATPase [Bradymonadales bacterium]
MNELHQIIGDHSTVVCVGSGGVGKTTTSAVIALHAALSGRKTLVMTIDPARRLANSLGLTGIDHHPTQVQVTDLLELESPIQGELWAMMLDMKTAFDEILRRNTEDEQTVQRIIANPFYHYFSTSLAGAQEYSAVQSLAEIAREGQFDLLVLDTPPARHAYDFLSAPDRLFEALDNSALQWLYKPAVLGGKAGLGFLRLGTRYVRRTLGKFTGSTLLDDIGLFIESMSPLLSGVKERAAKVRDILHDPSTVFLVVTSPDPLTIGEATQMKQRLDDVKVKLGAFIVNRVHRPILRDSEKLPEVDWLVGQLKTVPGAAYIGQEHLDRMASCMIRNAQDIGGLARIDARMIRSLADSSQAPVLTIPLFSRDIYSLKGLQRVRHALFQDEVPDCLRFQSAGTS